LKLDQRREAILKSLTERNLLTDELNSAIARAETLTALEDVFQPYRPKRRTRATIAKGYSRFFVANTGGKWVGI
jgi:uncharacterized protein